MMQTIYLYGKSSKPGCATMLSPSFKIGCRSRVPWRLGRIQSTSSITSNSAFLDRSFDLDQGIVTGPYLVNCHVSIPMSRRTSHIHKLSTTTQRLGVCKVSHPLCCSQNTIGNIRTRRLWTAKYLRWQYLPFCLVNRGVYRVTATANFGCLHNRCGLNCRTIIILLDQGLRHRKKHECALSAWISPLRSYMHLVR